MKSLYEIMAGFYMMIILIVVSMTLFSTNIYAKNVDANKLLYVSELEESNFSPTVVEQILADGLDKGYDMKIDLYRKMSDGSQIVDTVVPGDTVDLAYNVYQAKISISFDYAFSFIGSSSSHTLIAYAR